MATGEQILKIIKSYREERGNAPTYKEIALLAGISKSTVHGHIERLQKLGLLDKTARSKRAVSLIPAEERDFRKLREECAVLSEENGSLLKRIQVLEADVKEMHRIRVEHEFMQLTIQRLETTDIKDLRSLRTLNEAIEEENGKLRAKLRYTEFLSRERVQQCVRTMSSMTMDELISINMSVKNHVRFNVGSEIHQRAKKLNLIDVDKGLRMTTTSLGNDIFECVVRD